MPGGEDQYDRLHVLSPDFAGKRKTDRFNPRKLGDNKAPLFLRIPVVDSTDELRDGEGQIAYLTGDGPDSQGLYFRSDTAWTRATGGSGAPTDASYVVLSSEPGLSAESTHASLSGADLHDPATHGLDGPAHTSTDLSGLNGLVSNATLDDSTASRPPDSHNTSHESGGSDELTVAGLAGDLADPQDPKTHSSTHTDGSADEIQVDNLAGDNGTAGQVLGTDGASLSFQDDQDTTDHSQLTNVTSDQHHTDPTAGKGMVDEATNQFGLDVIDSGQVTLSSGTATVDTNISAVDATFMLALGVDDPGSDVAVAGELFFDTSDGTYEIRIDETDTSVGNPTVNYDIVRVR